MYPLKLKSDVLTVLKKFRKLIENFFHTKLKTIYTGGGSEYEALFHLYPNMVFSILHHNIIYSNMLASLNANIAIL